MNLPLNSSSLASDARLGDCSKMTRKSANDLHTSCNVNLNAANLYPCVASENYGYPQGSPCVLLAVNKVLSDSQFPDSVRTPPTPSPCTCFSISALFAQTAYLSKNTRPFTGFSFC